MRWLQCTLANSAAVSDRVSLKCELILSQGVWLSPGKNKFTRSRGLDVGYGRITFLQLAVEQIDRTPVSQEHAWAFKDSIVLSL
jgi:hypothetical protein